MHLFNTRKYIEKILQIYLSWLKSLYIILLYGVSQAAMLNKIIYDWQDMNQIKKVLIEVR